MHDAQPMGVAQGARELTNDEASLLQIEKPLAQKTGEALTLKVFRVYADSCGLKTAFLGNGGRNAATIFSLRYSSSG